MRVGFAAAAIAAAVGSLVLTAASRGSDPQQALARIRLIVTTKAATAAMTVDGATIASYDSLELSGPPGIHSSHTGQTLQLSRNVRGETAEARFDVILADLGSSMTWNLKTDVAADTEIEIYALTKLDQPRLVDRFAATGTSARFESSRALLDSQGQLHLDRLVPRLVVAIFYPWYTLDTWRDPQLADRPLRPYSTDDPADLARIARQARSAGIDVFAVSWQGHETDRGVHDERLRRVLDAARGTGVQVCAFAETWVANPDNVWSAQADPQTMLNWLTDLVDMFGGHPAYLRVGGRPVVFVYSAQLITLEDWSRVTDRLRASGRDALVIGDFFHSRLIEPLGGEFQYSNVVFSGAELHAIDLTESLRVRTFHLLRPNDRRRVWVASVIPGFDDRLVAGRDAPAVIDRADGQRYDEQWSEAIDTAADWVIVTSWNEWFENSEIEPSDRYGTFYLDRTRYWTAVFKSAADQRESTARMTSTTSLTDSTKNARGILSAVSEGR